MKRLGRCFIETGVFNLRINRTTSNRPLPLRALSSTTMNDFLTESEETEEEDEDELTTESQRHTIAEQALALAATNITAAMQLVKTQLPFDFMLNASR